MYSINCSRYSNVQVLQLFCQQDAIIFSETPRLAVICYVVGIHINLHLAVSCIFKFHLLMQSIELCFLLLKHLSSLRSSLAPVLMWCNHC